MGIYAPCRFPKVNSFESPLAQYFFNRCTQASDSGDLAAATAAYQAACTAEREYQEAARVRFAC